MADKPLAMCRGILYCYLAFELDEPHVVPGARFSCTGFTAPVPLYPLEDAPGVTPRRWVAVFPHVEDADQQLLITDKKAGSHMRSYQFSSADLKWQSRFAYRLKGSLASRMRDIERTYWSTGIEIALRDVFPASNDDDILRLELLFPYTDCDEPVDVERFVVQGSYSQAVIMEDAVGEDAKRHVSISLRVARDDTQTLVFAQASSEPGCQPGLLVVDAPMREDKARDTWERMMNAGEDPTYPHWLIRHRAQGFQQAAQREEGRDWSIGVLMIVDKLDAAAFAQSLAALCAQSVPARGVCLMGPGAKRARAHARQTLDALGQGPVVHDVTQALDLLQVEYLMVMGQHDVLEPDALYELARNLHEDANALLVYPDDDSVDRGLARFYAPRLKPDLDLDMLYANNYVGSCVLLRADALNDCPITSIETAEQWVYGTVLHMSAQQEAVSHVPRVLCHRQERKHPAPAIESDPQLLAEHLHSRNVSAHIKREDACNRVIYDVADPQRLVSIIIPTKDHASMLEDCIDSIIDKAGYDAFEIVLVENNSVEPETFAYYEAVTRRDDRVKIVTYEGAFNFSKIVNYGVAHSKGELVLVLNNDTKAITDGFLRIMAGYLERTDVGVVGPLLRYPDGLVQNAGIALLMSGCLGFMNQNRAPGHDRGYLGSLAAPRAYSAVLGACLMVRRTDFDAVGGFTEELAVTYNDIDFCWKLRERGLTCVFTPYAELYHLEFTSRGRDRVSKQRAVQTELEAGIMRQRWPQYFACGDPVYNPACDQENPYFKLGR